MTATSSTHDRASAATWHPRGVAGQQSAFGSQPRGVSVFERLLRPLTDFIRWAEPWDFEEEDPLLDDYRSAVTDRPVGLWD